MMMRGKIKAAGACTILATGGVAVGQCVPQWGAYSGPALSNNVWCVTSWDPDGPGPALPVLVAGGNFEFVGSTPLRLVGFWNGHSWNEMGGGVSGTVESVAVFDPDGPGPLLAEPVIGGDFTVSGSTNLNRIAFFRNGEWNPLGLGVGSSLIESVHSLLQFGPELIVGGVFYSAGGAPALGIARWDGAGWHQFPDERAAGPLTFAVIDGQLYAGGRFQVPGAPLARVGILRWAPPNWVDVGPNPPQDDVYAIALYQGQLYAGGYFTNACCSNPPAPGEFIARFDGNSWQPVGSGMNGTVRALQVFDPDGPGPMPELLIAGGAFSTAGGVAASGIAAWDGSSWSPLGTGTAGQVRALTVWRGRLVAAGNFFSAGGLVSPGLAFWGCPRPPCYANCDQSTVPPALNVLDFNCFLNRFTAGDAYANCDGSTSPPVLNVLDFNCFINRFIGGCE
jgi:hypothetical protein